MKQIQIKIDGMTCGGCANRVAKAIKDVPGVIDASVSLAEAMAIVSTESEFDPQLLTVAVESKGYHAQVEK